MITPQQLAEFRRRFEAEKIMTTEEQLRRWLLGENVHNGMTPLVGECCPDFSCCYPDLAIPLEERREFVQNNPGE